MPFPFYPIGAIVAGVILGGALTLFVAALMAIDRTASRVAGSVVSGLVSGIRGWSPGRPERQTVVSSSPASSDEERSEIASAVPIERVRPTGP